MALDIDRIQALCFDIDGTLSDTDDQLVISLSRRLQPLKFLFRNHDPIPFARKTVYFIESPGNYIYSLPDRLGIDQQVDALREKLSRMGWDITPKAFMLVPGAKETLSSLSQRYPMAVVSARGHRSTDAFLSKYNLHPFFKHIATAHTCEHTKPFPDPILWVAKKMDIHPEACLMIGDTPIDIQAGKAAGAQTLGVLSGFGTRADLQQAGADMITPSIANLPEILHM